MRFLLKVNIPNDTGNAAARTGTLGKTIKAILDDQKPEAVYFTEIGGRRTVVMIVELADASKIPMYAEPWFLTFNADIEFHPVMTPDDLKRAGLDALGKKWA